MRLNKAEKALLKFMCQSSIGTITIRNGSPDEKTAQSLWSKNLIKYIQPSIPFSTGYYQLNVNGWNEIYKIKKGK